MSAIIDRDIMVDPETGFFRKGNPGGFNKYTETEKRRILDSLFDAVRKNYTITQACVYAGVSYPTFNTWIKGSEELRNEYELAKQGLLTTCNDVVYEAIANDRNPEIAMKVLKAMDERYKVKDKGGSNMLVLADLGSLLKSIQSGGTSYLPESNRKVIDYDDVVPNDSEDGE